MNQSVDEPHHNDTDTNTTRRGFLKWTVGGISAATTAILAWPLVGNLIGPIYRKAGLHFSKVKRVDKIPATGPVSLPFPFVKQYSFLREQGKHDVWVIKKPSGEIVIFSWQPVHGDGSTGWIKKPSGEFVVFSPICPHLGCYYDWHPELNKFICPCHWSIFAKDGKVLGGPAPRPLDTLHHKVIDKHLMVEWERFKVGIPQKIRI